MNGKTELLATPLRVHAGRMWCCHRVVGNSSSPSVRRIPSSSSRRNAASTRTPVAGCFPLPQSRDIIGIPCPAVRSRLITPAVLHGLYWLTANLAAVRALAPSSKTCMERSASLNWCLLARRSRPSGRSSSARDRSSGADDALLERLRATDGFTTCSAGAATRRPRRLVRTNLGERWRGRSARSVIRERRNPFYVVGCAIAAAQWCRWHSVQCAAIAA